jgi:hypothetical protein
VVILTNTGQSDAPRSAWPDSILEAVVARAVTP